MNRSHLIVDLRPRRRPARVPGRARRIVRPRRQPGLRRRRQCRRELRERLRRALQPRRDDRRPHRLVDSIRHRRPGPRGLQPPSSGSVAPGASYLVQLASAAAVGAALPTPDATGTTNLATSGGKVALVHDSARAHLRQLRGQLLRGRGRARPRRVRHGHRLRRSGTRARLDNTTPRPARLAAAPTPTRTQRDFTAGAGTPQNTLGCGGAVQRRGHSVARRRRPRALPSTPVEHLADALENVAQLRQRRVRARSPRRSPSG